MEQKYYNYESESRSVFTNVYCRKCGRKLIIKKEYDRQYNAVTGEVTIAYLACCPKYHNMISPFSIEGYLHDHFIVV
jgi:hypothetical protein